MKLNKYVLSMLLVALSVFSVTAQYNITGVVTDVESKPLFAATVAIQGTTIGVITGEDGNYSLSYNGTGEVIVAVNFIGYSPQLQTIKLGATENITVNFQLSSDVLGLDEVVVTGVVNPKGRLESSTTLSTLSTQKIDQSSPRNTSEILRSVPGIRVEASAGEGNTNMTVRGVPISAGGSKYLQLQEDGLPLLQFGDMSFATADIFLRYDQNIQRIEAIRGGAASTTASNSPAGIVNFISKTGETKGGSFGTTSGLDYRSLRTDFEFGSPISEDVSFHFGGFLRQGEGVRTAGYDANVGGQFKANLTKRFDKGYARIYFKYLNDRNATYLPMPLKVEGTNSNPVLSSVDGFDASHGTIHSPYFSNNLGVGPDGSMRRGDVQSGLNPISSYVGTEFHKSLDNGWSITNRSRFSSNSGRFISPFPVELGSEEAIAESIAGNNASLVYADNGSQFGNGYQNNGLVMRVHMFDTELNNFNNMINDTRVSKSVNKLDLTFGLYNSYQNVSMSWLWNSYLMEVNGENGRLLNVLDSSGASASDNGLYAYGVPAWGNCCQRNYDVKYLTTAPYAAVELKLNENINVDASYRYDMGSAFGSFASAVQSAKDMNNDGTISKPEEDVSSIDNANTTPVNYAYNYGSFSAGVNYKINENKAVFTRVSQGGSAKADRLLFTGLDYTNSSQLNVKDILTQAELGYKQQFKNGGIYATAFYAQTQEEGGFEATTQEIIENDYQSFGLEVEAAASFKNGFDFRSGLTYVNSTIMSGENEGNKARRQPGLMYSLAPTYKVGKSSLFGLSLIGQTKAFAQDNNELVMPGFSTLNGFVSTRISNGIEFSVNANNILNSIGITESEEGSITDNSVNYIRARSITGRSVSFTMRVRI